MKTLITEILFIIIFVIIATISIVLLTFILIPSNLNNLIDNFNFINTSIVIIIVYIFLMAAYILTRLIISSYYKRSSKRIPKNFKDFYDGTLKKYCLLVSKVQNKIIIFFSLAVLVFILCLFSLIKINYLITISLFAIFLTLLFLYFKFYFDYRNFKKDYYNTIFKAFLNQLDLDLNYSYINIHEDTVAELYKKAHFYDEYFNTYIVTNHIYGNVSNDITIDLNYLHLINKEDSTRPLYKYTVFKGIFAYSEINKSFPSSIKILINDPLKSKKVNMDNYTFEKLFDVISDNQILAMRILTPDVQKYLVDFYQNSELNFEISINEDKIYFRFKGNNIFDKSFLKNPTNLNILYKNYSTLYFIIQLIQNFEETLNNLE